MAIRFPIKVVVVLSLLALTAGCENKSRPETSDGVVAWFQVYLYENDQFVGLVAEGDQHVPGDWIELKLPDQNARAKFRVLDVDRKSVQFEIGCNGTVKIGRTNNWHHGEVVMEEDGTVLKFAVEAGGTVAPFARTDPELKTKFTVFRIQPGRGTKHDEKHIRGREIVETQSRSSGAAISSLYNIMSNSEELSLGQGADCFDPHHAIRVENNEETIDIIICFECWAIRVYRGGSQNAYHSDYDEYELRDDSRLKAFLAEYFPNDKHLTSSR
jgi:hypothetical protein